MGEEAEHAVSQVFITILENRMKTRSRGGVRLTGWRGWRDSQELCSGQEVTVRSMVCWPSDFTSSSRETEAGITL